MNNKISVVINTFNEEKNIKRAMNSVSWADEIVVCDMESDDRTVQIAKSLGAKVISHKKTGYVEPARNFAISQTQNEWVLILDADEEIPESLADKLRKLINEETGHTFVQIPRRNIIFGKWMKASGWWPDYNIRFFKKGNVVWSDKIHSKPQTSGVGLTLSEDESLSITHYNYDSVFQFINRMNNYTDIQAKELSGKNYKFSWPDIIQKPVNEFLSRFFAQNGYKDGLHGLSLSLLQAFSFLVMYLKVWELEKFEKEDIHLKDVRHEFLISSKDVDHWYSEKMLSKNPSLKILQKIKNKLL